MSETGFKLIKESFHGLSKPLEALKGQEKVMIDTVMRWSAINSGSGNIKGLALMEQEIVHAFAPLKADISFIDLTPLERVGLDGNIEEIPVGRSILIRNNPGANRRILLTGHFDTVFPPDHAFQNPKWLEANILNGPGVADMKGGILVMLYALMAFEASDAAGSLGWEVLLSPDEETGSIGSAPILAERAQKAQIGLTFEPALADGTLAGARKGSGNYTVVVRGRSAHAGREFSKGRNAVVVLSEIIGALAALSGERPGLTVNPAVLSGGVAPNIVPDLAQCRFNVRLNKPADVAWFEAKIADIIAPWQNQEGIEVRLHGGINRPPKAITPAGQLLMDAIKECGALWGVDVNYVATGGCCEGNNLAAAGLPNVDTLGVRGGEIHSAQEFVCTDSFVERATLSATILYAYSKGYLDPILEAEHS